MAEDRKITMGLNTDAPPDRLGDQALMVENLVPTSASSVGVRGGVELVKHYQPNNIGRSIIVDGLPADEGAGILVVVVNVGDAGLGDGNLRHVVEGLGAFRPARVAAEYDSVVGFNAATTIYGVLPE